MLALAFCEAALPFHYQPTQVWPRVIGRAALWWAGTAPVGSASPAMSGRTAATATAGTSAGGPAGAGAEPVGSPEGRLKLTNTSEADNKAKDISMKVPVRFKGAGGEEVLVELNARIVSGLKVRAAPPPPRTRCFRCSCTLLTVMVVVCVLSADEASKPAITRCQLS